MRIAILLAIHNQPQQANIFIRQCLSDPACEVFIHIDKKAESIETDLVDDTRVHILPKRYHVEWGDFTQIAYVLELMSYASAFGHFDYYSLHSGNDLWLRPVRELIVYLEEKDLYAYLDCHPLPWKDWQYGGGLGRLALIWPVFFRRRLNRPSLMHLLRAVYGRMYGAHILRGRKLPEDIQFWGKSAWYTLRGDCVERCLTYIKMHPEFTDLFRTTLCGDEIFFPTLVNLTANGLPIEEHNNLRYINLNYVDKKNVGAAQTFTMKQKKELENSNAFFGRKFDAAVDSKIIEYFLAKTI